MAEDIEGGGIASVPCLHLERLNYFLMSPQSPHELGQVTRLMMVRLPVCKLTLLRFWYFIKVKGCPTGREGGFPTCKTMLYCDGEEKKKNSSRKIGKYKPTFRASRPNPFSIFSGFSISQFAVRIWQQNRMLPSVCHEILALMAHFKISISQVYKEKSLSSGFSSFMLGYMSVIMWFGSSPSYLVSK